MVIWKRWCPLLSVPEVENGGVFRFPFPFEDPVGPDPANHAEVNDHSMIGGAGRKV